MLTEANRLNVVVDMNETYAATHINVFWRHIYIHKCAHIMDINEHRIKLKTHTHNTHTLPLFNVH